MENAITTNKYKRIKQLDAIKAAAYRDMLANRFEKVISRANYANPTA